MPVKYALVFILAGILTLGCQSEERPLFAREKMVNILIDVHLSEAALQGLMKEEKDSLTLVYYNQIYQIHSINEQDFLSQMEYMKHHPQYMEKIYEEVLAEITRRDTELHKKEEESPDK